MGTNKFITENYLTTDGSRGSTRIYTTISASSNSSGATGSSDEVSEIFQKPDNPREYYQAYLDNPSTYTVDVRFYIDETDFSTGSSDSWIFLDSTDIGPSTNQYYGGLAYKALTGAFNGNKLKISFNANTTGTSDSTDISYRAMIKEWY